MKKVKKIIFLELKVQQVISRTLRPGSSWTANSDKKYMELNGVALKCKQTMCDFSENSLSGR